MKQALETLDRIYEAVTIILRNKLLPPHVTQMHTQTQTLCRLLRRELPILEEVADLDTGEQDCIGLDAKNFLVTAKEQLKSL